MFQKEFFKILHYLYCRLNKIEKHKSKFIYNVRKQKKDSRDYSITLKTIPKGSADISLKFPPVYDQGQLGSCTANGWAAVFDYIRKKSGKAFMTPSRLFIYYNERVLEGSVSTDSGAQIRDGAKTLNTQGVCTETLLPYNIAKFAVKPSTSCYSKALLNEATLYQNIKNGDIATIKALLDQGIPTVIGISVYSSFESATVAKTGMVPMPNRIKEQLLGGHCVVIVGYDDTTSYFKCRNSWGTSWGAKGYFYLPYAYVQNTSLTSDLWALQQVK